MTYKEAIDTIESNRPTAGYTMLQEALDIAEQAIEKQIPKKPYVDPTQPNERFCFRCGADVIGSGKYCYLCGQRIDWESEED